MTTLVRTLTFRDLFLLVVGCVIGSGIFLVPGLVLQNTGGSAAVALFVWVVGGILCLLGALTYGELSSANPEAGGLYIYIRDAFGKFPAFLFGWGLFFVMGNGAIATLSVAFTVYLREIIPLSPVAVKIVSVLMITAVTFVNVRGTRRSADLLNWMTAIKVTAILVMSATLLSLGKGYQSPDSLLWPASVDQSLITGFGIAMISVLWAYEGWQFVTFSAGETIDPQRNYPRAFLAGSLCLIFLYLLANISYFVALGTVRASSTNSIASVALSSVVGDWAGKLVACVILVSIFSATNGIVLTATRAFYAMALDKLFFVRLAEVHSKYRTPAFAIITGSVWAAILAVTGTFQQLLTYVVFGGWIFYVLGAAAIYYYRRHPKEGGVSYRVPGYPFTPFLFIIAGAALVVNTVVAQPKEALAGIAILLSGTPAYLWWRRNPHQ